MSRTLQATMLLAVIVYFVLLLYLLKKRSLNLKYSLLWLASGFIMLILALFPRMLDWFAALVGVYDPTNALFAVVFFCILCILMSLTAIVSKLNKKVTDLTQTCALLEKRLREVEETARGQAEKSKS